MRELLKRGKNELKFEKEKGNSLRIIVRDKEILLNINRVTHEINTGKEGRARCENDYDTKFFDPRYQYGET